MATTTTTTTKKYLYLFGANEYGALGLGNCTDQFVPNKVSISSGGAGRSSRGERREAWGRRRREQQEGEQEEEEDQDFYEGEDDNGDSTKKWTGAEGDNEEDDDSSEIVAIGCGGFHLVLVTRGNDVFVAGRNDRGQISKNQVVKQSVPVLFEINAAFLSPSRRPADNRIASVCCGFNHTVLLMEDGRVFTFGLNDYGTLGCGHEEPVHGAVLVEALAEAGPAAKISTKGNHTLALMCDGSLFGWGANECHQLLPDPSLYIVTWPTEIASLRNRAIDTVAAGCFHSFASSSSGHTWAWGANSNSQCGIPSSLSASHTSPLLEVVSSSSSAQAPVGGPSANNGGVVSSTSTSATSSLERLLSAKDNNATAPGGAVGPSSSSASAHALSPSSASSSSSFQHPQHRQQNLYQHQSPPQQSSSHHLGNSPSPAMPHELVIDCVPNPTIVPSLDGRRVAAIACGYAHTLFLLAEQDVVLACGQNSHGECGMGHSEDVKRPTRMEAVCHAGVRSVVCGYNASYFLLRDGLYVCGTNTHGELGLGPEAGDAWLPVKNPHIPGDTPFTVASSSFCAALPVAEDDLGGAGGLFLSPNAREPQTTLSDDLSRALSSHFQCDLTLQAGDDGSAFAVHRAIVTARCNRLAREIEARTGTDAETARMSAQEVPPVVKLANMGGETLRRFLAHLYSGTVLVDDAALSEILALASVAQIYGTLRLLCICEDEVAELLTEENVVLVLREACELRLFTVKRICMEFIHANYSASVSARNRLVVECLGTNPELLAEVVGLSSPDFAEDTVSRLPLSPACPPSSLEYDMEVLLETGSYADVVFVALADAEPFPFHQSMDTASSSSTSSSAAPSGDGTGGGLSGLGARLREAGETRSKRKVGFLAHRAVLCARCPFFASAFRALIAVKEGGDDARVGEEDRRRVELVFEPKLDEAGRAVVREINQSAPAALHAFLLYVYTDRLDGLKLEVAVDVLQMAVVYGLGGSRLAHECERLLRVGIDPGSAVDTLCVAHQLQREDLKHFTLDYVVENLVACVGEEGAEEAGGGVLREATADFPELGYAIIRAVAERLRQRGAEDALKKVRGPSLPPLSSSSSSSRRT